MGTLTPSHVLADLLAGILGGIVVVAGIGLSQLVATGLTMGLRIGIDGSIQAVGVATSPWIVGIFVIAFSGLLFAARSTWWVPIPARLSATGIVITATVIGIALLDASYVANFGTHPWYWAIPIEVSRSVATYAFIGISVVSMLSSGLRRRHGDRDDEGRDRSPVSGEVHNPPG